MTNLNDTIDVSIDAGGAAGTRIVCHHLATAAATDPSALDVFKHGEAAIHAYFEKTGLRSSEQKYREFLDAPAQEKALVSNDRFGAWLQWQAESMTGQREHSLVNTADHTLAVILEKHTVGEAQRFDVTCYDPNRTMEPFRTPSCSPADLAKLTFLDCFPEMRHDLLARTGDSFTVTAFSPGRRCENSCRFIDFQRQADDAEMHCLATSLHAAVQYNVHTAVMPIAQRVVQAGYCGDAHVPGLLDHGERMDQLHGAAALSAAVRNDATEVIRAAPALFKTLELSEPVALGYLSADHQGWSGLNNAARFGRTQTVEAMLDAFVDFRARYDDVQTEDLVSLLQGESFADTSVQDYEHDDDENELRADTPESEDQSTPLNDVLLNDVLREAADTPALHLAATQGHFGIYGAFARALVQLDLPMEERMRVLDARDGWGRPALSRAVANKKLDCYQALGDAAQRAGLGTDQQVQLLIAKDHETGNAPHQLAIQLEISGASDKLRETLKAIGLPDAEIRRAVLSGDGKGNDSRTLRRNSGSQEELERALERTSHSPPPSPQQRVAQPRSRNSSPSSDEQPDRKRRRLSP